jgi:CelD/BcsL family acetyltransferase involved in cellulose biosynthesis
MPMPAEVRNGAESIEAAEEGWRSLWERDPAATLFQRPEYTRIWLTEFAGDRSPAVVEVRDGGALTGLVTLSADADGVLRFLGDPALTDYFGPVSSPEDRDAVASAIVQAVEGLDWQRAELCGLSADAGWFDPLARAAKASGFAVDEAQQEVCPRISLGGTFDDYLMSLNSKLRHEIKRKARKLEREAGPFTIRLETGSGVHDDMETFFDMYRASEGPKGHFAHWGLAGFFILLARTFGANGWLRLSFLEIDGKAIAGVFAFAARGTWYVYNAAFDQSYRELAPGMVLMAETIRLATEEGAHTFDLMRGDEPYKYRFGAVDVPLTQLTFRRT